MEKLFKALCVMSLTGNVFAESHRTPPSFGVDIFADREFYFLSGLNDSDGHSLAWKARLVPDAPGATAGEILYMQEVGGMVVNQNIGRFDDWNSGVFSPAIPFRYSFEENNRVLEAETSGLSNYFVMMRFAAADEIYGYCFYQDQPGKAAVAIETCQAAKMTNFPLISFEQSQALAILFDQVYEADTMPGKLMDADGDGVVDSVDGDPLDPFETLDSDGDGLGDNSDLCPNLAEDYSELPLADGCPALEPSPEDILVEAESGTLLQTRTDAVWPNVQVGPVAGGEVVAWVIEPNDGVELIAPIDTDQLILGYLNGFMDGTISLMINGQVVNRFFIPANSDWSNLNEGASRESVLTLPFLITAGTPVQIVFQVGDTPVNIDYVIF